MLKATVQFPTHLVEYLEAKRAKEAGSYNTVIQAALEAIKANPDLPVPAPSEEKRFTVRLDSDLLPDVDGSPPNRIRWALWTQLFEKSIGEIRSILAVYLGEETDRALEQIIPIIVNLAGHISPAEKAKMKYT